MKKTFFTLLFTIIIAVGSVAAQTSWLDSPLRNWNRGNGQIPNAPRTLIAIDAACRDRIRTPDTLSDRAVTRAGWSLFGSSQTFGAVTVVNALAGFDGTCRPTQYNSFAFVNNRYAGSLSPTIMDSRTDGSLIEANLNSPTSITAEFARYTSSDALCCPSQKSYVTYIISSGISALVTPSNVDTSATCANAGENQEDESVVTGNVTYRQRIALPPTAILTVKLLDVSRADTSSTVIAEQRIQTAGKQVPFAFSLPYKADAIQERNRYAVQAQITDNERLLYISDVSYPVLTQSNPKTVEIVVVPVRGGNGQGQGNRTLRGTVTYLQRSALPGNSTVTVRLIDTAPQTGTAAVIAETTTNTDNRQVPLAFELPYEQTRVNNGRNYALEAEIKTDGKIAFKTESPVPVQLRGNADNNIQLTVIPAVAAITGKAITLSKFGTGSLKIGDNSQFLIRANVSVQTDGSSTINLSALDGSTVFSGKLTYFDDATLRFAVESSGNADATGEIEIKYSGRRLNSITSANLMLDGQSATIRF